MHPMVDDGINFLNRVTGGANQIFDWYMKADEKKNNIEQVFKDNPPTRSSAQNATDRGVTASANAIRRSAM